MNSKAMPCFSVQLTHKITMFEFFFWDDLDIKKGVMTPGALSNLLSLVNLNFPETSPPTFIRPVDPEPYRPTAKNTHQRLATPGS